MISRHTNQIIPPLFNGCHIGFNEHLPPPGEVVPSFLTFSSSPVIFFMSSAAGSENFASLLRTVCVSCAGNNPPALFFNPCEIPASTAPDQKINI